MQVIVGIQELQGAQAIVETEDKLELQDHQEILDHKVQQAHLGLVDQQGQQDQMVNLESLVTKVRREKEVLMALMVKLA
jgi:hypothetical protein